MATTVLRRARPGEQHWAGMRAMLPLLAGLVPLGMTVGAAVAACESPGAGFAGTWLIFSASAQLTVLDAGPGWAAAAGAIVAAFVINARFAVYGITMGRHWRDEPAGFKALMAATLVEVSFALGDARYRAAGSPADKRAYFTGAALTLWFGWMAAVIAGSVVGSAIGAGSVLRLVVPLFLVTMLAPALDDAPGRAAATAAVSVAIAGSALPAGVGVVAAIAAGSVVGAGYERRS
jgi:predicted branched-subunit amino acid permease